MMGGGRPMGHLAHLLAVAILLSCGQLIHCNSGYYKEGDRIWCTLGVTGTVPNPCELMRRVFPPAMTPSQCNAYLTTPQNQHTLYTMSLGFAQSSKGVNQDYLQGVLDATAFEAEFPNNRYWPNTLKCYDINECVETTGRCSHNAACYNEFFGYKCECMDGYMDNSPPGSSGYVCQREAAPVSEYDSIELELWVYILIGIAGFVVLMLIFCCCCFYSADCCDGAKHIRVVNMPPPREKKVVIEIDKEPSQPAIGGPQDGKLLVAQPSLPWQAGGGSALNPPQLQMLEAPQPMICEVVQAPDGQYMDLPTVQGEPIIVQGEPMLVQGQPMLVQGQPVAVQQQPTMLQSGAIYAEGSMMIE